MRWIMLLRLSDFREVTEVAEDSPDAKKWPLWKPSEEENVFSIPLPAEALDQNLSASGSGAFPSQLRSELRPPSKRPGPRKPKTSLTAPSSQKAKKLTTLDKSAMDWSAHIN